MANQPYVFCDGPHNGPCPNRTLRLLSETGGTHAHLAGGSAEDVLRQVVKLGRGGERLHCEATAGQPCPFVPEYDGPSHELRLFGELVLRFEKQSRQTELLEAFQLPGWPRSIKDPLGEPSAVDAENGLSDIVYELNRKQRLRPRIRFRCKGRSVHWEFARADGAHQ